MQKSRRDRRAHRVHTAVSCAAVTAEQGLNLFVARQVSSGGTFFDDLPFIIGDVVVRPSLFDLMHETRDPLLLLRGPGEHPIEDFLQLLFCHKAIIPDQPNVTTAEMWDEAGPIDHCAQSYELFCRRYRSEPKRPSWPRWGGWRLWREISGKPAKGRIGDQADLFAPPAAAGARLTLRKATTAVRSAAGRRIP
jgi:hypothetical protein